MLFTQSRLVDSKPLSPALFTRIERYICIQRRFGRKKTAPSTSTLDLVPALAALNKSAHYESEKVSECL